MAVLRVTSREAVRQICRVFRELRKSLMKENKDLKDRVRHLETERMSNCGGEKTLYKIKPSGQFDTELPHRT